MKTRSRIGMLLMTYAVMAVVCVYLTSTGNDVSSVYINAALFAVAGGIFLYAAKCFERVGKMADSLRNAKAKIASDYLKSHTYLWPEYKNDPEGTLLSEDTLSRAYKEYVSEMKRLEQVSGGGLKCSIEDYIDQNLIDAAAKKNILNLVPGTMTGLGILGTFVGLSIGLQNFNTGSVAEISSSIAPLMDGIKVAFHTSIYGMIFSLVFNFVYKQIMEETYDSLDDFLASFKWYVSSDANHDNVSNTQMILKGLPAEMGETIAARITDILVPAFDKMSDTMENFAVRVGERQLEGLNLIVNRFIEEMNKSLGNSFEHLGLVLEETSEMQRRNNEFLQDVLKQIGDLAFNIHEINEISEHTIECLSRYVDEIENLQKIINENFMSVSIQMEAQNEMNEKTHEYVAVLADYEKQIADASGRLGQEMMTRVEQVGEMSKSISDSARENAEILMKTAEERNAALTVGMRESLELLTASVRENIETLVQNTETYTKTVNENAKEHVEMLAKSAAEYNTSLADISKQHLQDIIALADDKTEDMERASKELSKVLKELGDQLANSFNSTFEASYEGMEQSFGKMQEKLDDLVRVLGLMKDNLTKLTEQVPTKEE